jgi:hypothetical protein
VHHPRQQDGPPQRRREQRRCAGHRRGRHRAATASRGTRAVAAGARAATLAAVVVAFGLGQRRRIAIGQAVTTVDPDLHTDDAVGRLGFGEAIVDVGLQRVKRHASFAVPLAAGDLDAVQAARGHDLDTQSAQPHRVLHRALHGAAEHDALFELLGDRVGDQLCIDFGLAHLFDVDCHRHAQAAPEFGLQVLDVLALLADHDTRTRREDRDAGVLGGALDEDARDGRALQLGLQVVAHLQILGEHRREVLLGGEPA